MWQEAFVSLRTFPSFRNGPPEDSGEGAGPCGRTGRLHSRWLLWRRAMLGSEATAVLGSEPLQCLFDMLRVSLGTGLSWSG